MIKGIIKVVLGLLLLLGLSSIFFTSDMMILGIVCVIAGIAVTFYGISDFFGGFGDMFRRIFKKRGNSSSSSSSSSDGKRYGRPQRPDDVDEGVEEDNELKEPDDHVGWLIASEIEKRLPAVTPSTGLSCSVYGSGKAYLNGTITLWHASDSGSVRNAIESGFNAALRQAAEEGYDVSAISGLDPSGVTIKAADAE